MFTREKNEIAKELQDAIKKDEIKRFNKLKGKFHISTSVGWINALKAQANAKGSLEFVKKAEKMVNDLLFALEQYQALELELEASRQRNLDLESLLIIANNKNQQFKELIDKMDKQF